MDGEALDLEQIDFERLIVQDFDNGYAVMEIVHRRGVNVGDVIRALRNAGLPPPVGYEHYRFTLPEWRDEFLTSGLFEPDYDERAWLLDGVEVFVFFGGVEAPSFNTAYSTTGSGGWNVAATWGGGGTPAAGDTADINNTHTVTVVQSEACLWVDVNAGGVLTIDAAGNATPIDFVFDDAATAGIRASAGTINGLGDATWGVKFMSLGGTAPANYYDMNSLSATLTMAHTTIEACSFVYCGVWTWDYVTVQFAESYGVLISGGNTVNQFDNVTVDEMDSGGIGAARLKKNMTGTVNNLVITNNNSSGYDVQIAQYHLEVTDCNFDMAKVDTASGGEIISINHNDVAGDYAYAWHDGEGVSIDATFTTNGTDDIYLYISQGGTGGVFEFDRAATYTSLTVQAGKQIEVGFAIAAIVEFTGDMTNLWDIEVGAGTTWEVDPAAASTYIEFQNVDNIDIANAGTIDFQGTSTQTVYMYVDGTDYETAATYGIDYSGAGDWKAAYSRIYHMTGFPTVQNSWLYLAYSVYWFDPAGTAPVEIELDGKITQTWSLMSTYNGKDWYIRPTTNYTAGTVSDSYFDNLLPTISHIDTFYAPFIQGVTKADEVYPSLVDSDPTNYVSGENIKVERSHKTRTILKLDNYISHDEIAKYDSHLDHREFLSMLGAIHRNAGSQGVLDVFWNEGCFASAKLVEFKKPQDQPGMQHHYQVRYTSVIIQGPATWPA